MKNLILIFCAICALSFSVKAENVSYTGRTLYINIDGIRYGMDNDSLAYVAKPESGTSYSGDLRIQPYIEYKDGWHKVNLIQNGAFQGCKRLRSIVLPETLGVIPSDAFHSCDSLSNVVIPNSINTIGQSAFTGCYALEEIYLPNTITEFGNDVFSECLSLRSIHLPESLTKIGGGIFMSCSSLTSIVLPEKIEILPSQTFSRCSSLKSVYLGENIKEIADLAFLDNESLDKIIVESTNEKFTSIDGVLYDKNCETLVRCPDAREELEVPPSVKQIGQRSFANGKIKNITGGIPVSSIGECSFGGCDSLKSVEVGWPLKSIGMGAFNNCRNLESFVIPSSVTFIDEYAFEECNRLLDIYAAPINAPRAYTSAFSSTTYEKATLHYNPECFHSYRSTLPWSKFNKRTVTSLEDTDNNGEIRIRVVGNTIILEGSSIPVLNTVYDFNGRLVTSTQDRTIQLLPHCHYIVKAGAKVFKVSL